MLQHEPMSKHTSLHVGGPADWYVEAHSVDHIKQALSFAKEQHLPVAILGGGSNSIFSDAGFRGVVIRPQLTEMYPPETCVGVGECVHVRVECGMLSALFARKTADLGLAGFEWAATLPGTIGGAVRGNAGCFGGEIKDNLISVEVLRDNEVLTVPAEECNFSYRESAFKHQLQNDIILSALFRFTQQTPKECHDRINEATEKRRLTQPFGSASAGCMFKNFMFNDPSEITTLISATQVPPDFVRKGVIPAGWLIERAELKGFAVGGASVSTVHGNFLVVAPGATADQVLQLVAIIKTRIRDQFGVQLTEEVQSFI